MPSKVTYDISWYLYMILGVICICFISFLPIALIFVLLSIVLPVVKRNTFKVKGIVIKWVKMLVLPICISLIGLVSGFKIFESWQIYKFNNVIEKINLYESNHGKSPISLTDIGFSEEKIESPFYAMSVSKVSFDDSNCILSFRYDGILLQPDTHYYLYCCRNRPYGPHGPIVKFITDGVGDFNWYHSEL